MKFDKAMLFYKRFLLTVAILPFDSRDFKFIGTRLLLFCVIFHSFFNVTMYIGYGFNGGDITIDYIGEVVLVFGMYTRYYILFSKRREVKDLMDECESIWNECNDQEHQIVLKFERKVRRLFLFLLYSSNFINVLYILTAVNINRHAVFFNGTDTRVLITKWYGVDRVDLWPGYKITFAFQISLIFNACIASTIADSVAPVFMMFSSGYFATLTRRFEMLEEAKDQQQFDREFFAATMFHKRLLHFSHGIEKLGKMLFLCQLLSSGYNMSIIGIKLAGTDPRRFQYLPNLLTALGELLICQYAPDYLLDESKGVATAAYGTIVNMMRQRSVCGKLLVLVILRANRPVQMTAGGVVDLSMESFGQVMKSAFSFFMVLRSMNI